MNPPEPIPDLYTELNGLVDLDQRILGLTGFDKLQIIVHKSGEVIELDTLQFAEPLLNTVRSNIRDIADKIKSILTTETFKLTEVAMNHAPVRTIQDTEVKPFTTKRKGTPSSIRDELEAHDE